MRVFVAGAAGVIGRSLVPMLVKAGHEVTGGTRSEARADDIRAMGAEPVIRDVFDAEAVKRAVAAARPEVLINELTALPTSINPRARSEQFAGTNRLRREASRILMDAAAEAGARRVVAQSIAFVYRLTGEGLKSEDDDLFLEAPPPSGEVVAAVAELERNVTRDDRVEGVVLRYGYFYGPGTAYARDGSFADLARRRRLAIVGPGTGVFSFIHVDDAARATVAALDRGSSGIYNVVDDDPAPVRDWVPAFAEAVGAPKPRRVPAWLARVVAGRYTVELMTASRGASNAKAHAELGLDLRFPSWREGFREGLG
ncbi:MAG TPA: NAD(P)-dependent oxidoreductase [Thermoleophilaceae bacterium]